MKMKDVGTFTPNQRAIIAWHRARTTAHFIAIPADPADILLDIPFPVRNSLPTSVNLEYF
jgi:hypothetical protein